MNDPDARLPSATSPPSHAERLFPRLTEAQIHRIAALGLRRQTTKGETLVEVGEGSPFFVVVRGSLQVLSSSAGVETVIVTHGRGEFTGEANLITGRRSLARLRVTEDSEVVELNRSGLLALIQTDAELSAILMRTFILRRADLIAGEYGAVTIVGSTHSAGTYASGSSSHATAIRIATSTSIAIGTSRSCSINSTSASTMSPS